MTVETVTYERSRQECRLSTGKTVVGYPVTVHYAEPAPLAASAYGVVVEVLVGELAAEVVVVGKNFRFGRDRRGDFCPSGDEGSQVGRAGRVHAPCVSGGKIRPGSG